MLACYQYLLVTNWPVNTDDLMTGDPGIDLYH